MSVLSHGDCQCFLAHVGGQYLLVYGIPGEAAEVPNGAKLHFDSTGWAWVAPPGGSSLWAKDILHQVVAKHVDGRVLVKPPDTSLFWVQEQWAQ
eukprot:10503915-Lingulodinium_polyedra.AAC.1